MYQGLKNIFKRYFLAGLLVLGPLVISIYVVKAIVNAADAALGTYQWFSLKIPGLGFAVAIVIILFAGFLGKNVLGRYLFIGIGDILARVPVVGGIYSSTKQVLETLLGSGKRQFGRVVLIHYPHKESWSLAFVTSETAPPEVQSLVSEKLLSVYVPTTPNPTSGFYIYVPQSQALATSLTVDQAFKVIVSLGLAQTPGA